MVVKGASDEAEEEPKGFLYALEIENFKSFKGKHYIGPFRYFSAIIGPNGSGKSNLMDAISFVLGERSNNLRVRKLGDLIHGASVEKAEVNKCRVSMIYVFDKNDESKQRVFTRSVVSSLASEFRIDNEIVTPINYHRALEEIQIFIKAKNFLVYQGSVERVAMQNPKELTQTFEELSRSNEFKIEYERLKAEMLEAESNAQTNLNKRRDVALERREAKMEKDEARKYHTLKDDLATKNKELYLVQLYFVEHSRNNAKEQLADLREQVDAIRGEKAAFEAEVAKRQAVVKSLTRDVQKLEQRITKEERKLAQHLPLCNKMAQEIEHIKMKRSTISKVWQAAQKIAEENERKIAEANVKIEEAKKRQIEIEQQIQLESQKMDLQLNPEQLAEYRRLKAEAQKRSNISGVELDNKKQEQETDRNALEYEERRLASYQERIKQKNAEIERERKNVESLMESEQSKEQLRIQEQENLRALEEEVAFLYTE